MHARLLANGVFDRRKYPSWSAEFGIRFKVDGPACKLVDYNEGVFLGYGWSDEQKIEPRFAFATDLVTTPLP
jgi:hypothetical protein